MRAHFCEQCFSIRLTCILLLVFAFLRLLLGAGLGQALSFACSSFVGGMLFGVSGLFCTHCGEVPLWVLILLASYLSSSVLGGGGSGWGEDSLCIFVAVQMNLHLCWGPRF